MIKKTPPRFSVLTHSKVERPDLGDYTSVVDFAQNIGVSEPTLLQALKRNEITLLKLGEVSYIPNTDLGKLATLEIQRQLKNKEARLKAGIKKKRLLRRDAFIAMVLQKLNPSAYQVLSDSCAELLETYQEKTVAEVAQLLCEDYANKGPVTKTRPLLVSTLQGIHDNLTVPSPQQLMTAQQQAQKEKKEGL